MSIEVVIKYKVFFRNCIVLFLFFICVIFSKMALSIDLDVDRLNVDALNSSGKVESVLLDNEMLEPAISADPHAFYKFRIESVLEGEDFGSKETKKAWRIKEKFKDKDKREERVPEWLISIIEFFESLGDVFLNISKLIEVVLWIVVVLAIGFLLVKYRKPLAKFVREVGVKKSPTELPSEMFGLDIRQESLPKSIVQSAKKMWESGEQRQALALLFRASLSHLLYETECSFQAGDTELDCYQKVAGLQEENLTKFMHVLTNAWLKLAYAHQAPSNEGFALICQQWEGVFDAR
jgi:hypothetical protein